MPGEQFAGRRFLHDPRVWRPIGEEGVGSFLEQSPLHTLHHRRSSRRGSDRQRDIRANVWAISGLDARNRLSVVAKHGDLRRLLRPTTSFSSAPPTILPHTKPCSGEWREFPQGLCGFWKEMPTQEVRTQASRMSDLCQRERQQSSIVSPSRQGGDDRNEEIWLRAGR